jgi:ribosomal protein S18 acetylase RimI-like enzyme
MCVTKQAYPEPADRVWEISTYEDGDKAGVLALVRDEYGDVDLAQEAYFDWLRSASPPGVRQWLVREKETRRVISSGTTVGARATWRGKGILALLGFNIIVAPKYRRQGIHTKLTRQTGQDVKRAGYRFTTVFPNPKSKPQLDRSKNFHHVSEVPLLVRPLDMRFLTEATIPNRILGWGANLGWQVAGRTLWRGHGPGRNRGTMRISEDTVLDESYDRFWGQVQTKYDLMLVRDRAFLQWRFQDIPTREYQILSARENDTDRDPAVPDSRMFGYIVLRQAEVRGIRTGMIADFVVLHGNRGDEAGLLLLQAALQRFEAAQVPLAGGLLLPHTQEYTLMRRAGFLNAPRQFAPQSFHLFIRSYCDEPPLSALVRPESWYVSIADHDAV